MLVKPNLKDERIITCLQDEYGLSVAKIDFMPLGADLNTAVYRVVADDDISYFVKLRRCDFNEASVAVPKYLSEKGIKQIIPSLSTQTGQLWATLEPYRILIYPYIQGNNGYEVNLSDQQRIEFGTTLKRLHTAEIPSVITNSIHRESFSSHWREKVKMFLARIENETYIEPVAVEMAAFLKTRRNEILDLVNRSERLALILQVQSPEFILCHGDIHAWNLLIDVNDSLYIVDWDTLIYAPKERDLMFVGAGLGGNGHSIKEEEELFYQGYGPTKIDHVGLAYYRYERIIEDIAVYCEQIFFSDEGGEDRDQALENVKANFLPNSTVAISYQSDKTLMGGKSHAENRANQSPLPSR